MLLMSTGLWIVIAVAVLIVVVFVGTKIKDKFY